MIKMKPLLKESTWTNRKFGESLPTLEDYMGESYDDENCGDGHAVVSEADDDDKYVSIGWGKYKEKGKEDDKDAPTFKKTDSGKYVKGKDDEKGEFSPDKEEKPEKEPAGKLGGGDFERDFDDDDDDDEDEYPASKEDPINAKKTAMEDEMEDIAQELDNVTDPDEKADLEYRYDSIDKELASINKQQYGDDSGYEPFTDDPDDIDDLPDDEDDYDMGVVPGSRELDDTPEDDSEKGSSLTSAPGRVPDEDEYPDKDPINTKKGEMEDEMEDIANELDNVTDPDEKKELEDRYDKVDQELYDINKKQYGDDSGYEKSGRTGNELNQETLTIDGKQYRRISEGVEKQLKPKYEFSEFYQRFKRQE